MRGNANWNMSERRRNCSIVEKENCRFNNLMCCNNLNTGKIISEIMKSNFHTLNAQCTLLHTAAYKYTINMWYKLCIKWFWCNDLYNTMKKNYYNEIEYGIENRTQNTWQSYWMKSHSKWKRQENSSSSSKNT